MKTNRWLILLAVAIPGLMIEMAGTSVFVAFERIASDLNVSIDRSVWLTTIYLAVNAMMIPLAAWLGKKLGYKKVIISGIVIFGISALLGALARSFEALVLFRALQGLGDGPIMPIATALLFEVFPAKERGRMMAGIMLALGIAPALGPLIASWLVDTIGWRAIFYFNFILGMISLCAVTLLLPSSKPVSEKVKVNWLAFVLLAIATGSLQLFLDRGEQFNWFNSNLIWTLFIAAVLSMFLYMIVVFMTKDSSVLELKLLKNIPFLTGNLANMLLNGSLYGALMIKIFYLQWLMGFTAVQSGFYQASIAGSMLLFSVLTGIIIDKINPRWTVLLGLPICVYALFVASGLNLYSDMGTIITIGIVMGAGIAFVATPISVTVFSSIKREDMASASVLNSYLFVISGSISLSLVTIFLMHRIDVNTFYLSSVVTPENPAFISALGILPEAAVPATAEHIMRQGAMFAFNDIWYMMAFIMILILLYVPFMKRAKEH